MSHGTETILLQHLLAGDSLVVGPSHEPAVDLHLPVDMATVVLDAAAEVVERHLLAVIVRLKLSGIGVVLGGIGVLIGGVGLRGVAEIEWHTTRLTELAAVAVAAVKVVDSSGSEFFLAVVDWHVLGSIKNRAEALVWALVYRPLLELTTQPNHGATFIKVVERTWLANQVAWANCFKKLFVDLDVTPGPLRIMRNLCKLVVCQFFQTLVLQRLTLLILQDLWLA